MTRVMTTVFLHDDERVLLLHREGSRVIEDSWVGIGGHVEPGEDVQDAALRELTEEVGLRGPDLRDLRLRYAATREADAETRVVHYFTARLADGVAAPTRCTEGTLRWFALDADLSELAMPPTGRVVLDHWQRIGRFDAKTRDVRMERSGGVSVVPG
ncbi:NUDIX domain-containing protein [Microbacterium sp. KUDC0406]|uniref:NUDIX domain-containing protein n=1 Tax=Microbacterium sp. KUDC0406 TaxID=2909588 RepID=UPI001F2F2C84|nr:NUDIX domain-containing protein [Microbacterium sp. KUDC0406]UJP11159.1 NUDIX domain-containing protein [Microbacterium sp. KUDC0406]